ncbi:uncharacterized protein SOCE26_029810 [Sorangium cellulosum]|uniref:Uncharacterized protein n=1 Tax=Sorangium cellulosum TaxID=56 RepID=A0A2L0EQL5_SORCE|nr:uncharacterized protein SOCE26_029810 [Sorangium cellulosum]
MAAPLLLAPALFVAAPLLWGPALFVAAPLLLPPARFAAAPLLVAAAPALLAAFVPLARAPPARPAAWRSPALARTRGELLFFSMAAFSPALPAACSALRRASSRSTSTPPFLLAGFFRQLPCSLGRFPGTGSYPGQQRESFS